MIVGSVYPPLNTDHTSLSRALVRALAAAAAAAAAPAPPPDCEGDPSIHSNHVPEISRDPRVTRNTSTRGVRSRTVKPEIFFKSTTGSDFGRLCGTVAACNMVHDVRALAPPRTHSGIHPAKGGGVLSEHIYSFYEGAQLAPYELTHVRPSPGDCAAGWAQGSGTQGLRALKLWQSCRQWRAQPWSWPAWMLRQGVACSGAPQPTY